jgi:hypothetical protein
MEAGITVSPIFFPPALIIFSQSFWVVVSDGNMEDASSGVVKGALFAHGRVDELK